MSEKIILVLDTKDNERIWVVNTTFRDNIEIPYDIINEHNLVDENTKFTVEYATSKCRENGVVFRMIKWKGFETKTRGTVDFIMDD